MSMYNFIEYSDNYVKTSGSLWQYYRDEPNDNLVNSESFKFKVKITGKSPASLWQYYRDEPNDNLVNSESFKFKVKITGKSPAADNFLENFRNALD